MLCMGMTGGCGGRRVAEERRISRDEVHRAVKKIRIGKDMELDEIL